MAKIGTIWVRKGFWDYRANDRRTVDFEIDIDPERLIEMVGAKAVDNKSGQTKLAGGAITIRASKVV
jgi:hypothetical protein